MTSDPFRNQLSCYALAATISLGMSAAIAAGPATNQDAAPQASLQVAALDATPQSDASAPGYVIYPMCHPACQAAVRKAAAESPRALLQYIRRTRMIYNFYIWDIVKPD
jgi:hypothetical protein